MFERLLTLINEEQFNKIKNTKILLVGLGGVGGYTLEALIRSGFQNITIVDGDIINESNLNRQIISNNTNIGNSKALEAKQRALSINSEARITIIDKFLTCDNFNEYINSNYDYIIDACDDIKIKISLIKYAGKKAIKIITCLGTGRKLDATKLEITTLDKTYNDPLAKKLRSLLRKDNIDLKIPVVFSQEKTIKTEGVVGSSIFTPGVAGLYLANYVFLDIIKIV